ncbi:hypothetical protein WJX73_006266 [Symbiochloris irregularis]|uniref:SfsA N-terminal OB domain-containing protein n=1 Tax=Symbiochloris irregularis TaxID=706552 RepID=A0AAW1NYB0_9CHLO
MKAFEASRVAAGLPQRLRFPVPLVSGVIEKRPNRFVMECHLDGQQESVRCHVPVTGKVAGLSYKDMQGLQLPCLLSTPSNVANRKTQYTVEALALEPQGQVNTWYGINQSASTRYIGHFLSAGAIPEIVADAGQLVAERKVGKSTRIDFVYAQRDLIEVKTPLAAIPLHTSTNPLVQQMLHSRQSGKQSKGSHPSRLTRHLGVMVDELEQQRLILDSAAALDQGTSTSCGQQPRSILVQSYMYDAPAFRRPTTFPTSLIGLAVERARLAGVELWQVNMALDPEGVTLLKYFPIAEFGGAPVAQ